jgi:hypothetical protein
MNKVHGGTPRGGTESICRSCRHAQVTRGTNNQELILCRAVGNQSVQVGFPVYECNSFDDKSQPPLYEMQNIAWIVRTRNRGPVGFTDTDSRTVITVEPPQFGIGPATQGPTES